MQLNQPRQVAPSQPPVSNELTEMASVPFARAPIEAKRVKREERAARFGPLPGEVYSDEAHFGSFN